MDSNVTGPVVLSPEEKAVLTEGIGLILSRWTALQAAVDNGWGGRDSRRKAELTVSKVFDWFTQSKDPLEFDGLADILDGALLELNTVAEDGSVEEVTEKLLDLYEDCLDGNYQTVETLRGANSQMAAQANVVKVSNGNDDESDDDDEDDDMGMGIDQTADMMVDASGHQLNMNLEAMPVDEPSSTSTAHEAEDGWTVVSSRRNKGKRK